VRPPEGEEGFDQAPEQDIGTKDKGLIIDPVVLLPLAKEGKNIFGLTPEARARMGLPPPPGPRRIEDDLPPEHLEKLYEIETAKVLKEDLTFEEVMVELTDVFGYPAKDFVDGLHHVFSQTDNAKELKQNQFNYFLRVLVNARAITKVRQGEVV